MSVLEHPQPLGVFGYPAGFLLVPASGRPEADARRELVAGRRPRVWPASLRGHELAHDDDLEQAAGFFAGEDPVARYNRWVLDPERVGDDELAGLRAGLPPAVRPLVDVVAHSLGRGPAPAGDPDEGLPDEVAALVLAARATQARQDGDAAAAARLLTAAGERAGAASPALRAVLLGSAAGVQRERGASAEAESLLRDASAALAGTDLSEVRAELLHTLGGLAHERAASGTGDTRTLLHQAMGHYYDALQLVSEQSAPVLWASLQMDLATAHLAVPMTEATDQLRLGVATQALRACRRVFDPEQHAAAWSAATLNLANALVYTPSTHQADNLVEAVELYEEVLVSGVRDRDPLGRARLMSNQGNVLAHLGAFGQARVKLVEARSVFEEHLDYDGATTVRSLLDELARSEAAQNGAQPEASTASTASGVGGGDAADLDELARQAEQMSRMPLPGSAFTAGMGVRRQAPAGDVTGPPPKPRVTVLPAGSAPRRTDTP